MVNNLLETIANAMKGYDVAKNHSPQSDEFYWCLAWTGLQDTKTWTDLNTNPATSENDKRGFKYALTPDRLSKISNIIAAERTGQPQNGVTPKGKKVNTANCYQ